MDSFRLSAKTKIVNKGLLIISIFIYFDTGNGTVSQGEWVDTFKTEFGGTQRQAECLFCKLDKDGSGDISLSEVSELFVDMDSDGEFIAFYMYIVYVMF